MTDLNIPKLEIPRVVILGGGFAGLKLARKLNSKIVQTVLIDKNNFHTFQPLLYQVATAGLEPDSIAYPLRKTLKKRKRTHIRMANIQEIIPSANIVKTSIGEISYDFLVIATGAQTNYFGNENIEKYAMPMKSLVESLNLRSLMLQNFEEALNENDIDKRNALMSFVIVGGGPTGVELAGALAELKKHVLPNDYPDLDIRQMQIHLMEGGPRLLSAMSAKASRNALNYLKEMDINIWTDTIVNDYDGHHIYTSKDVIESSNLIWAAGVKGNIPKGIDQTFIEKDRIKVNNFGFIEDSNVAAIGDVAIMRTTQFPDGLPMLASVAQQQGAYLAKCIHERIRGSRLKAFEYKNKGTMATVGRNKAVVDLGKIKFGGALAWLAWLFVHLMLLVDFRSRLVVFLNWVWNYISFDRGTRLIVRKFQKET